MKPSPTSRLSIAGLCLPFQGTNPRANSSLCRLGTLTSPQRAAKSTAGNLVCACAGISLHDQLIHEFVLDRFAGTSLLGNHGQLYPFVLSVHVDNFEFPASGPTSMCWPRETETSCCIRLGEAAEAHHTGEGFACSTKKGLCAGPLIILTARLQARLRRDAGEPASTAPSDLHWASVLAFCGMS